MTSNYHTPIAAGAEAKASSFNDPLGQMDEALTEALLLERDGHIVQNEGVDLAQQPRLNFVGGNVSATNTPGVTIITIADTPAVIIQNEGVDLPEQPRLNFVGANVLATDGSGVTTVTISGIETLTANRTYYVRADGNDGNTGLVNNAGGAFLTKQFAINNLTNLNFNGYTVTIQVVGNSTAGASISGKFIGQESAANLIILGDTTTPANCLVTVTGGNCFELHDGAQATIRGFKVSTITSGDCLLVDTGSYLIYGSMDFSACAGMHVDVGTYSNCYAAFNYTISGGAVGHFHTGVPSLIFTNAITITLSGTPAFSAYFAGTAGGFQMVGSITFAGTGATGKRYLSHKNGVIDANGGSATFLPGNVAGTTDSGGRYVGDQTTDAWVTTYVPTVLAGVGTLTTASATCRYRKSEVDKVVHASFVVTVTNNGTGSSYLTVTLPVTPAGVGILHGINGTTFKSVAGYISSTLVALFLYDGTYPIASGQTITFSITYEIP